MATAVLERPMSKMGRPKGDRDDVSTRIDRRIVGMARAIAAARGLTIAEYLSDLLAEKVGKDYAAMLRELEKGGPA